MYLLPNCTLELGFVAWVAENALDCAVVNTKGRTVTLYRCVADAMREWDIENL